MAAALSGSALGALWSCGKDGIVTLCSAEGETATTSAMYDWDFEFEIVES